MSWNSAPVSVRLWRRIKKIAKTGCWEWQGSWSTNGYGRLRVGGKIRTCHRLAWEVSHGEIPAGLFVCHTCDNRKCINPAHLFLGTSADNNADRDRKGRSNPPKGERHPHSKLSEAQVRIIRERIKAGEPLKLLAYQYAVSRTAIAHIKKGWTYVET